MDQIDVDFVFRGLCNQALEKKSRKPAFNHPWRQYNLANRDKKHCDIFTDVLTVEQG